MLTFLGYVTTLSGRRNYFPDINSWVAMKQKAARRQAVNTVCQGSASDLGKPGCSRVMNFSENCDGQHSFTAWQIKKRHGYFSKQIRSHAFANPWRTGVRNSREGFTFFVSHYQGGNGKCNPAVNPSKGEHLRRPQLGGTLFIAHREKWKIIV